MATKQQRSFYNQLLEFKQIISSVCSLSFDFQATAVDDKPPSSWEIPATKWDVARVAGLNTLAIRELVSCILLVKLGKDDELKERIDDLSKRADKLWELFSELTKTSND